MQTASYAEYLHASKLTGGHDDFQAGQDNDIATFSTCALIPRSYPYLVFPVSKVEGLLAFPAGAQISPVNLFATTVSNQFQDIYDHIMVGGTALSINLNVRRAAPIFRDAMVTKFRDLSTEWKSTRNSLNSGTEMFMHPAYQKIIGMGQDVVPLIFSELEKNIDHWFWALKAITEADPVPPAHRGRLGLMAKDWLSWARTQGYEW